jgi:hypothetical protein
MLIPKVIYKNEILPNSWCRWSVFRVKHKNNSTNIRFTGDTGSGKSWSALSYAESCAKLMDREFTPDRIYFSIRDVINDVAKDEPKPGTIFFVDEQQVGAGAKEHASKKNQIYTKFLSTVRSNRYIIITTLPFSDMEDKQLRRLFHVEVETMGANESTNTVKTKPRFLEHSRVNGKTYRKRLLMVYVDPATGKYRTKKISTWDIKRPSQNLIDVYERMKTDFKRKLYTQLAKELDDFDTAREEKEEIKENPTFDFQDLPFYQREVLTLIRSGVKRNIQIYRILNEEKKIKISTAEISRINKMLKKRGFEYYHP